jgi:hypothetical protein
VLEAKPNKDGYTALGNAYIKVLRCNEAAESFINAVECDSDDQEAAPNCARSLMVIIGYDGVIEEAP